jgi:hypothetical protein
MRRRFVNDVPSVAALRCQLQRIQAHHRIAATLPDDLVEEFRRLTFAIFAGFDCEQRGRAYRKHQREKAESRKNAKIGAKKATLRKPGGANGE